MAYLNKRQKSSVGFYAKLTAPRLSFGFRLPIFISHQDGTFYTDVVTAPKNVRERSKVSDFQIAWLKNDLN